MTGVPVSTCGSEDGIRTEFRGEVEVLAQLEYRNVTEGKGEVPMQKSLSASLRVTVRLTVIIVLAVGLLVGAVQGP